MPNHTIFNLPENNVRSAERLNDHPGKGARVHQVGWSLSTAASFQTRARRWQSRGIDGKRNPERQYRDTASPVFMNHDR